MPDLLTGEGTNHLMIEGWNVDNMGLFEWLAFTLQDNPKQTAEGHSILLANRYSSSYETTTFVPLGFCYRDSVYTTFGYSDVSLYDAGVRITIS